MSKSINRSIIIVADYFANEISGGGEINNEVLYELLIESDIAVEKIKSGHVTLSFLEESKNNFFIIANFMHLAEECKRVLLDLDYCIYEHDHKYLRSRNPAMYDNFIAPKTEIVNLLFYKKARAVFCQSNMHCTIVKNNTGLENIINLGGNLWSDETLSILEALSEQEKVSDCFSIMDSPTGHKNTQGALYFCNYKGHKYDLIEKQPYYDFLKRLSSNEYFVFFPQTPETLSRIVVEARMMNVKVVTNNLVGACSEQWFSKKGPELINFMRHKKEDVLKKVLAAFEGV